MMATRLDYKQASLKAVQAQFGVEQYLSKAGLELALMQLVRLRASQLNGCAFCVDMHYTDARKEDDTERRLAAVVVWRETPFFTQRERAALAWTEAVTLVAQTHVPDDVFDNVRAHFPDKELVDLTLLIGSINTWNRIAISFRQSPE
jgi:AhpD family alkylhydroperoxidase